MVQAGIILKVPRGSPAPPGYIYVRSLRTANIYKKEEAQPVPQAELDDLINMFGRMGVVVQVNAVDDLERALGGLAMGGKRRTRSRKSTKRKHKYTRKHKGNRK